MDPGILIDITENRVQIWARVRRFSITLDTYLHFSLLDFLHLLDRFVTRYLRSTYGPRVGASFPLGRYPWRRFEVMFTIRVLGWRSYLLYNNNRQ